MWMDWINEMSTGKWIIFLALSDGGCIKSLQIIIDPQNKEELNYVSSIYKEGTKGVSVEVFENSKSPAKDKI